MFIRLENLHLKKILIKSIDFYNSRITERNKRVLRIIKNIIGEDKMDFTLEQILMDLIQNKGDMNEKSKDQSKRIYEEYLKL